MLSPDNGTNNLAFQIEGMTFPSTDAFLRFHAQTASVAEAMQKQENDRVRAADQRDELSKALVADSAWSWSDLGVGVVAALAVGAVGYGAYKGYEYYRNRREAGDYDGTWPPDFDRPWTPSAGMLGGFLNDEIPQLT